MKTDVVINSVTMKDLVDYFKTEYGHNRKHAEYLARSVAPNKNDKKKNELAEQQSKELLPSGWHQILHPPKHSFERRLGFDLFADTRGGGTYRSPASAQERSEAFAPEKKTAPVHPRQEIRTEAVQPTLS